MSLHVCPSGRWHAWPPACLQRKPSSSRWMPLSTGALQRALPCEGTLPSSSACYGGWAQCAAMPDLAHPGRFISQRAKWRGTPVRGRVVQDISAGLRAWRMGEGAAPALLDFSHEPLPANAGPSDEGAELIRGACATSLGRPSCRICPTLTALHALCPAAVSAQGHCSPHRLARPHRWIRAVVGDCHVVLFRHCFVRSVAWRRPAPPRSARKPSTGCAGHCTKGSSGSNSSGGGGQLRDWGCRE